MEASKSGTKKRVLPPWMTAQEIPRVVKTPKKRKAATPASTMSRPTLRTVYCMNEAELVDEALKILLEVKSGISSPETSAQAQGRPDLWSAMCTHVPLPFSQP